MEAFEIIVNKHSYKVIRDLAQNELFNVFNHAAYYLIKKNNFGIWEKVEHRFGTEDFSVAEVGDQIDKYFDYLAFGGLVSQASGNHPA